MATIRPFKAVRPQDTLAKEVAALPYDVYSREEAKEAVQGHPLSFLNIDRPETQYGPEFDMYSPKAYETARDLFKKQVREGVYQQEESPCYYLYSLTMDGRTQNGLVACSSVDDYRTGVILKHENTRADKELDRIRHVDTMSAQTGPIFLAYRDSQESTSLMESLLKLPALVDFVSEDGIRHVVRKMADPDLIQKVTGVFGAMPHTYIADGHHRAASAVKVAKKRREEHPDYSGEEEFNYFLSVLFPESELKILDYNRVVKDLNGLSEEEFLKKLSEKFEIVLLPEGQVAKPGKKGEMGLYLGNRWYRLNAKPSILKDDPVEGLDVSLLQNEVLAPVLGIQDPKTDKRIDFIGGIRGLKELESRCHKDMKLAFAMYPTAMEELFHVADAGRLMPPKSTWFEPKLRSGLFIHLFEG